MKTLLLIFLSLLDWRLTDAAITWAHFKANVDCDPTVYADEAAFASALVTTWDGVATDDNVAVYMARLTVNTQQVLAAIQGDFEMRLKEFVPPDLYFFFADKGSAALLRSVKADYGVDAVEALPAPLKLLRELRVAQAQAQSSGAEQPAVSIELSPGSKANAKQSEDLAKFWESAVHGATPGSVAKFRSKATDVITLEGVKGTEMETALGIVSSQPEALALESQPDFANIDPEPAGTVTPISRRLKGLNASGRLLNNEADEIVQSGVLGQTPLTDAGLLGQGEVVGIADSGLYDQSCFFNNNNLLQRNAEADPSLRKVIEYVAFADGIAGEQRDHGTHVAGSVAGSCTVANGKIYDGIAPEAKIHFFDIGFAGRPSLSVPGNLATGLFPDAKAAGAAIHTNSWGANINRYTTSSRDVDQYSYDNEEFVILIAAGNSGPSGNTVGSPATAKNSISVGASVNAKTGSIENMATFSSRGPTADGRIKPDVVAPGHSISSAASETACGIVPMSGTSMATPVTAGSVALIRQYFREGWYPSGAKNVDDAFVPSGALLKAVVIHSGKQMTGTGVGTYPGMSQGFGRVDLDSVLKLSPQATPERGTLYVRSTKVGTQQRVELDQGASFAKVFTMTGNGKLKATLVWMDPPSAINANTNLVNDLDLTVVCAGVTTYPNGGTGGKDYLNNVEMTELDVKQGSCTVTVSAATIRQGDTQPYALVVTGPFAATVDATPAPPEETTTTTGSGTATLAPAPAPIAFVKIDAATCGATCTCASNGYVPVVDKTSCERAAISLGLLDNTATYVRGTPRPEGCYYYNSRLYLAYNPANQGIGATGTRDPICKPASDYFAMITTGTCFSNSMVPINDVELCATAAIELGLADTVPYATRSRNRPEGCYYRDRIPGFSLFVATNAANVGNGATATRNQICQNPNPVAQNVGGSSGLGYQGIAAGRASRSFSSLLGAFLVVAMLMVQWCA